jgi:hypothetical protein
MSILSPDASAYDAEFSDISDDEGTNGSNINNYNPVADHAFGNEATSSNEGDISDLTDEEIKNLLSAKMSVLKGKRLRQFANQALASNNNSTVQQQVESSSSRDWNAEYQSLMDKVHNDESVLDNAVYFTQLSELAHDFLYTAKTIGRIIISEKYISDNLKTIQPFKLGTACTTIQKSIQTFPVLVIHF